MQSRRIRRCTCPRLDARSDYWFGRTCSSTATTNRRAFSTSAAVSPAEIRKCVVVGLAFCRLRSGEDAPEVEGDGPLGGRRGFQSVTLTELGKVLPSPLVGLPGVFTEGRLAVLYCLSRKVSKLRAKCGLISPLLGFAIPGPNRRANAGSSPSEAP